MDLVCYVHLRNSSYITLLLKPLMNISSAVIFYLKIYYEIKTTINFIIYNEWCNKNHYAILKDKYTDKKVKGEIK